MIYNTSFKSGRQQDVVSKRFCKIFQALWATCSLYYFFPLLLFPLHISLLPSSYVSFLVNRLYISRPWVCHSLTIPGMLSEIRLKSCKIFIFLALPHGMQDLSSLARVRTCASCSGSTEFQPLDCQGSPLKLYNTEELRD